MPAFRSLMENREKLSPQVLGFFKSSIKACEGCRYCVQTDKTGTRPLAAIEGICTMFPGFSLNYRKLDHELAQKTLMGLDELDSIL
jgi:hypothetical protein